MFASLEKLESINLEKITTSKVVNMDSVFSNCKNLFGSLYLDNFHSTSLTTAKKMFENCEQLTVIYSPNFSPSLGVDTEDIFKNCRSLHRIYMTMNSNMLNYLNSIFSEVSHDGDCYNVRGYRDEIPSTVSPSVISNMQSFNLLSKELSRHYIKTISQNIYGNKTFDYTPIYINSMFNNTTLSLK